MKRINRIFILSLLLLFSLKGFSQHCYLWGYVNGSEWKYLELSYDSDDKLYYANDVTIIGGFHVTTSDLVDMKNADWQSTFRMFGYCAYDIHRAKFPYSYEARYPMKRLAQVEDQTQWLMFEPKPGNYRVEVILDTSPATIALLQDSNISETEEYKKTVEDFWYYSIDGKRTMNPTNGFYIHQRKKILIK